MKNILIINAHQKYEGIAEGHLTQVFINKANEFCKDSGFSVKNTHIDLGYDIKEELEKLEWADYVLFQFPVYWMGLPWVSKKYIDEVISAGQGSVTYENDGRSRDDTSKKYGSGGLMKGKSYMLSLTYNCPTSEFDNKDGYFDGLSLDEANISTHKIFQFCGMKPLETYSIHDIFKGDLDIEKAKKEFTQTLEKNFKG